METELVRNGRLTVPLFHGTSTLFYDSILASGLGGRNIVEDLGIRDAARLLVTLCEEYQPWPDWRFDADACIRIAEDPTKQELIHNSGFNFRYGGTYVSASRSTATTYALLYDCGSEALAYSLKLFKKLSSVRPDLTARAEFSIITAFAEKTRKPLVIEAHDVEVGFLRAEQGGDSTQALRCIEDAMCDDPDFYDLLVQQENFELVKPVPPCQLRFYEVKERFESDGSHHVVWNQFPSGLT